MAAFFRMTPNARMHPTGSAEVRGAERAYNLVDRNNVGTQSGNQEGEADHA